MSGIGNSLLNWPNGMERTPPDERQTGQKFSKSFSSTKSELGREFDRMDVDEWRLDDVSGSGGDPGVVLRWKKDGNEYAVACDAYTTKSANLRSAYLYINETRMREKRPVETVEDAFAAARLPPSNGGEGVVVAGSRPAHEVLGIPQDASDEEAKQAYREQAKEAHTDQGGSTEEFQELREAFKQFTGKDPSDVR